MANRQMIPDDETKGYAKTSLTMTRAISNDIGMKLKKILEQIHNTIGLDDNSKEKINLTHAQWQEVITYLWNDPIWSQAFNILIIRCRQEEINLNRNLEFLIRIAEKAPSELKAEFSKTHPIARLSLMDLVTKEPPVPKKPKTVEELWP